jgi:hypothetical protein
LVDLLQFKAQSISTPSRTMKLVDYSSDSESADSEDRAPSPPPAPRPQHATLPKPIKKRILVDLPKPTKETTDHYAALKKRPRPEGGGGGLFSVLPPPKRAKPVSGRSTAGNSDSKLGSSVGGSNEAEKSTPTAPSTEPPTTTAFVPRSAKQKKTTDTSALPSSTKEEPLSLFPLGPELTAKPTPDPTTSTPSTYEPLIAQPILTEPIPHPTEASSPPTAPTTGPTTISTSDLDSFAAHILEGRHRKNRTINIVDYNAGEVYAQNAMEKASGVLREQVAPVRAIGTGRHQLTQLLNNVQDQKESLEESFAKNRRIKKESGAKYGW